MAWTPEKVALLTKLWIEGYSASLMGVRLGVSRNSVLGKVHRIGLAASCPRDPRKNHQSGPSPWSTAAKERQSLRLREIKRLAKAKAAARPKKSPTRIVLEQAPLPAPRPVLARKTFLEIDLEHDCKFIPGDPRTPGPIYCGQPVVPGTSWCPDCLRICMVVPDGVSRKQQPELLVKPTKPQFEDA